MNILLFATAWGPLHGGINAFNRSLAIALASELGVDGHVYCATTDPAPSPIQEALRSGVTLVPLSEEGASMEPDGGWAAAARDRLSALGVEHVDLCIGHDTITGAAAVDAAALLGARSAVIHHMDYRSYHGVKGDTQRTDALSGEQAALLLRADLIFSVGPLLGESARRLAKGRSVIELIPGLEDAPAQTSSDHQLEVVTFGRFDVANRVIKQGRLAAMSFGLAARAAHEARAYAPFKGAPLSIVGLDPKEEDEAKKLQELADGAAKRVINVLLLPFTPKPAAVMERLAASNLALVLSLHEGFSLTAWEAIAAATPLILTENSGVHRLLKQELRGTALGCVKTVDIRGSRIEPFVNAEDQEAVAEAIGDIARDIRGAKDDAIRLRDLLRERIGCSWSDTARQVLQALSSGPPATRSPSRALARIAQPRSTAPHRPVTASQVVTNPLPRCAHISLTLTQGGHSLSYDLVPEVRFGRHVMRLDGLEITCALKRADLALSLEGCEILPGERLGDRPSASPSIISEPPSRWRIEGPLVNSLLAPRPLGDERLCAVGMNDSQAVANFSITCHRRDISFQYERRLPALNPAKKKIMNLFLTKCLPGGEEPEIVLSTAALHLTADDE